MGWVAIMAMLVLLSGCAVTGTRMYAKPSRACDVPDLVAHRGAPTVAPENTVPSLRAAAESGVTWVEIDVQTSSDGVPVLFHDKSVDDLTDGSGGVARLRADQLTKLRVDGSNRVDATIPTLAAALTLLDEYPQVRLLLEIKGPESREEIQTVVNHVRAAGMSDRTTVQSFDEEVLARVRQIAPELPTAILRPTLDASPSQAAMPYSGYNPRAQELLSRPGVVDELHAVGVEVTVWTVDEPAMWQRLAEIGVDGIVTNEPREAVAWAEGYCAALAQG
jgi:glycerophosphoryl diester phosphodiesterase